MKQCVGRGGGIMAENVIDKLLRCTHCKGLRQVCADHSYELSRERLLRVVFRSVATKATVATPAAGFLATQATEAPYSVSMKPACLPLKDGFDFIPTFQPATGRKLHHFLRLVLGLCDTKELEGK